MRALLLIALAAIGYAIRAASRGDWMPVEFTAVLFFVYGAAFAAEWSIHRRSGR